MQFLDILTGHCHLDAEKASGSLIELSQMLRCFVATIHEIQVMSHWLD